MPNIEADDTIVNPAVIDEPHIHVVAAIIWNPTSKQFLISRRQKGKHLEDYWEFPGGKLEDGETPLQALQRELEEEINIVPLESERFLQVYHRYPDRNILLDTWQVNQYEGRLQARENQELEWVDLSTVDRYLLPAADIPVLDALKSAASE